MSGRSLVAGLLGLVAVLLVPVALVAPWATEMTSSTDRYVTLVTPLAEDPTVQHAIEDIVVREVVGAIDTKALAAAVASGVTAAAGLDLPTGTVSSAAVRQAVTRLVRGAVVAFVESERFPTVWTGINELAHRDVVRFLQGAPTPGPPGTVRLTLGPVVAGAEKGLGPLATLVGAAAGQAHVDVRLLPASRLPAARAAHRWTTELAPWAAPAAVALGLLALTLARRRAGSLAWLALGTTLTAGVVLLGPLVVRDKAAGASPQAALGGALLDAVTRPLETPATIVALGSAVVCVVACAVALGAGRRAPS